MLDNITVSPSPHISKAHSTRSIMLDVVIGLAFPMVAAVIFFRLHAVYVIATCVISCMATEYICNIIRKKPNTLGDLSAVVTGIILAFSLPASIPLWAAAIGGAVAIAIGKMVFGGLGSNVFNPAMVARTFMAASLGTLMTTWMVPATINPEMPTIVKSGIAADAVTQATPLGWSKQAIKGEAEIKEANSLRIPALWGTVGGCLGETSALALLLGGAYMLFRKTITFVIPTAVLGSAAAFAAIFWAISPEKYADPLFHLLSGGMLMCAVFIATDPVTAPLTRKGMWIFGIGVGVVVILIRNVGGYPEGVMFAVLLMNALNPLIERMCKLVPSGGKKND
ncbi:MAG: RnfABCDGE type electron transport complex subunit D [Phycisphaerae bacterium]|nr:RnfABCDGE type electron transport complex subunit D [Phycisphaerae bacterium]